MSLWPDLPVKDRERVVKRGIVPADYPGSTASDWPGLVDAVEPLIRGKRGAYSTTPWWQFERRRGEMYDAIPPLNRVLATALVSGHLIPLPQLFESIMSAVVGCLA